MALTASQFIIPNGAPSGGVQLMQSKTGVQVGDIDAEASTNGQMMASDGAGGASWVAAPTTTITAGAFVTVATKATAFGATINIGDVIQVTTVPPLRVVAKTAGTSGQSLNDIEWDLDAGRGFEYPYDEKVALLETLGADLSEMTTFGSTENEVRAIEYLGEGVILVGTRRNTFARIYRSLNYGASWSYVEIGTNHNGVFSITNLGGGIILAGAGTDADDGDVFRSTDYGITWTLIEMGATLANIKALEYCGNGIVLAGHGKAGADNGDVYRSTDYGLTWAKVEMGASLDWVLALKYLGDGVVLAGVGVTGGEGDVMRSTDHGQTWTTIEMGATLEGIYCFEALGNGVVFCGAGFTAADGDVFRSFDNGLTWTNSDLNISTVNTIKHLGGGVVLVGGQNTSLWRSTDLGQTWTSELLDAGINNIHVIEYLSEGRLMVGTGDGTNDGKIYQQSLTEMPSSFLDQKVAIIESYPKLDPSIALLETLGENLTLTGNLNNADWVFKILDLGHGVVLAATGDADNAFVFKSLDYGSTFPTFSDLVTGGGGPDNVYDLANLGDGVILAGAGFNLNGDGDVYRSTDYGESWTAMVIDANLQAVFAVENLGNGICLAGSGYDADEGDIWRSTDYGLNWTKIEMGALLDVIRSIEYLGNGVVLCGSGQTATDGEIYRSTDAGLTWTKIELPTTQTLQQVICIESAGNGIVLCGTGTSTTYGDIYKSTDYGLTWTKAEIGATIETVSAIKHVGGGVVLLGTGSGSGDGDVYRSIDYGVTWTLVEMGGTLRYVHAIEYLPEGRLLVGTGNQAGTGDIYTHDVLDIAPARNTPNDQTTTAYTLVLADKMNKTVYVSNASANTLTVPPNTDVAFQVGTTIDVVMEGAGVTTITAGAGVTLNGTLVMAQYDRVVMTKRATDTWIVTKA